MSNKNSLNMSSYEFNQNVHLHFAWMRQESPVYEAKVTRWKSAYLVTRYEDVADALKDPRFVKNPNNAKSETGKSGMYWMPKRFQPLMNNMLNMDEPDHRRLRNLVHKAFTPQMITALAPRIEAIASGLLDAVHQQKEVELIQAYALPLPVNVIAEMMGIPANDRLKFREWASQIVVAPTPLNMVKAIPAISNFLNYVQKLADERRRVPQNDLLTALVQAEDAGDTFTEDELLGMVFLLLVAGHETTVSLIANGTLALLNNPDQLERLRNDPTLIDTAVEELLRYDGPLQTSEASFARETISWHGVTIPQGSMVLPALLSANRDETVFENADHLDISRNPNKHLAFGKGIHYCLGSPLARLEGKIAFCLLLERFPSLRLAVPSAQIHFRPLMTLHRLESLPVVLE